MRDSLETDTDPTAHEWSIKGPVTQLRKWGTGVSYPLPTEEGDEITLGSVASCSVRLDHPRISRRHVALVRKRTGLEIRDLGSKNGVQLDGAHRMAGELEPGTELTVGGIVLIAESEQLIALRDFLARLLGWGEDRRSEVDRALRAVRMAVMHRAPLVLSGQGELALIARALHLRVQGPDKPFILCDPRRRPSDGGVRSVANREDPNAALQAALGGSLCFVRRRLPPDAAEVFAAARDPKSRVQLIVCTHEQAQDDVEALLSAAPIAIPPLRERAADVDRLISEYASEAIVELGAARTGFTDEDRAWVRAFSAASLPDIEKGTRRLVACRASRTVSMAARRLGMASVSLQRWIERRGSLARVPQVGM